MSIGRILAGSHEGVYLVKLEGDVRLTLCSAIDRYLDAMFEDPNFRSVLVDLNSASAVDSTTLGLLAKLSVQTQKRFRLVPALFCENPDLLRVLRSMGFEDVFQISAQAPTSTAGLSELPAIEASQTEVREHVLEAHRTLMELNESNRLEFRDLVSALESEASDPSLNAAAP
jgi:anti-anti-sigma factor